MKHVTIMCMLLMLAHSSARAQEVGSLGSEQAPQIVVSGRGQARVRPDRALVAAEVMTQARTAAEAASGNAQRVRSVLDRLTQMGYTSGAVSTVQYTVQPQYRYTEERERVFTGSYAAYHTLVVTVTDLSQVGAVIDNVLEVGATQISSTRFESSELDRAREEAIRAAVAQAHHDAAAMAEAAGGRLGDLLLLTTEPERTFAPGIQLEALAVSGERTPITPGEQVVNAVVIGRWKFQK